MHDGQVATLEAVIGALRRRAARSAPSLSPLMKPLALTPQEVQDLIAFMRSLSSPQTTLAMPNLPSN